MAGDCTEGFTLADGGGVMGMCPCMWYRDPPAFPALSVTLYIAGPIEEARRVVRRHCYERGDCLTVTPTEFIYTGGEEAGVVIGLINYPQSPSTLRDRRARMRALALKLLPALNQRSCTITGDGGAELISLDPPGRAEP
jgi:hypothetical protein